MKSIFALFLVVFINSCSHKETLRIPSSEKSSLTEIIKVFIQEAQTGAASNCKVRYSDFYDTVSNKSTKNYSVEAITRDAKEILELSFTTRLLIREKLKEWGDVTTGCVNNARKVMRVLRVVEEYVGLIAKFENVPEFKSESKYLTGTFPDLITPNSNEFIPERDLRSGDFIISRGNAFTSALISRMGDEDAQFSHLALVYVDQVTQKKYIVDAHIEVGVKVSPLEEYLKSANSRAAVFRQNDLELAHKAASIMYSRAKSAIDNRNPICYDFAMNQDDATCLFCSEVGQNAYHLASNGAFKVPLYESRVEKMSADLKQKLGITASHAFLPGDMEVDPRFSLIAEWRSFPRIRDTQKKDAVLVSMYNWMESLGYKFKPGLDLKIKSHLLWGLRRFPLFSSLLKNKFPKNMSTSVLEINFLLASLGENFYKELDKRERKLSKYPLTMIELMDILENIRTDDQAAYDKYKAHLAKKPMAPYPNTIGWHFYFSAQ